MYLNTVADTGEESIYFEMESKEEADGFDDVVDNYDDVARTTDGARPPPVPKRTSCEKCKHESNGDRHALTELENVCRSNTVIIRRMRFILATAVTALVTSVATLILVTVIMLSRDCTCTAAKEAPGKLGQSLLPGMFMQARNKEFGLLGLHFVSFEGSLK